MAGSLLGAAKVFADTGSELNDLSLQTGIAVESLSSLGFAADLSGASLADVQVAARKMQQTLARADEDGQKAADTLDKLGLSVEKLEGLKPEEQFRAAAHAIGAIADPAKKTAAAIALFGKSGQRLLPMIDDLDALEKKAHELGIVWSSEDAAAADALGDAISGMWAQAKMLTAQLGAALAPALQGLIETVAP